MKFIKLPIRIASLEEIKESEIKESEITNAEIDWDEGYGIVNIDEIEAVTQEPDGYSGIVFKSGENMKIFLSIDKMASLLESK